MQHILASTEIVAHHGQSDAILTLLGIHARIPGTANLWGKLSDAAGCDPKPPPTPHRSYSKKLIVKDQIRGSSLGQSSSRIGRAGICLRGTLMVMVANRERNGKILLFSCLTNVRRVSTVTTFKHFILIWQLRGKKDIFVAFFSRNFPKQ